MTATKKLRNGKGYTVCIKSTQKWAVAVWRGDHWVETTHLGRIEPGEIETIGVMIKSDKSTLQWWNYWVCQWLFFRVCRHVRLRRDGITFTTTAWGLMLFPIPGTGWGTPYKYLADKGPYYIWIPKRRKI